MKPLIIIICLSLTLSLCGCASTSPTKLKPTADSAFPSEQSIPLYTTGAIRYLQTN